MDGSREETSPRCWALCMSTKHSKSHFIRDKFLKREKFINYRISIEL